jgi:transposase
MGDISAIGVDLSKAVLHIHGANSKGELVWRRKVGHEQFGEVLAQLPERSTVYMEACGSAHYWSRKAESFGLRAKQISPQFVKPFVKSQKNDYGDAEAVIEAASRPAMRFVATKTVGQQEVQAMHRIRSRRIAERTALMNQMRGILLEHGITICVGPERLKKYMRENFCFEGEVSPTIRLLVEGLYGELNKLEKLIEESEKEIKERANACGMIKRLMTIPGVGILTATALACVCGDVKQFKNGRQFAAWLGLVPRQVTTGGKPTLLGISKRGDIYTRMLLIHGARALVHHALKKEDVHSLWIRKLHAAKGTNLTSVAVANKNARIAWRIMISNEVYDAALPHAALRSGEPTRCEENKKG